VTLASIPSPSTAVWHLGPFPLRAYALCIIAGIIVCAMISEQRMRSRGAPQYAILDIAVWAVPFGIIGARIYNVATSWQDYFGKDGTGWVATFKIWQGGLGIWGAVAGGAVGAWIACRMMKIPLTFVADCLAPALPVAQGLGRFGNWFNNELYGKATTLPWGLRVHQMDPSNPGHALIGPDGHAVMLPGLYQPTFLYEVVWDLGTALFVYLMDRKFKFGKGRAFALYVMAYTVGRGWIEYLRIDQANHILGLRLNDWTAIIVFLAALIYFIKVKGSREFLIPNAEGAGYVSVTEEEAEAFKSAEGTTTGSDDAGDGAEAKAGDGAGDGGDDGGGKAAVDKADEVDAGKDDVNKDEADADRPDSADAESEKDAVPVDGLDAAGEPHTATK
jgi:prolipoprotein diacylglyceryl transferase